MTDKTANISKAGLVMAILATATSVSEAVKSHNENERHRADAAKAEAMSAQTDILIQKNFAKAIEDLSDRASSLEDKSEAMDRKLFELDVMIKSHEKSLDAKSSIVRDDPDHEPKPEPDTLEALPKQAKSVKSSQLQFVEPELQYSKKTVRVVDGFRETVIGDSVIMKEPISK